MEYKSYISKIKTKAVKFLLSLILAFASLAAALELVIVKDSFCICVFIIFICLVVCTIVTYRKEYSFKKDLALSPFEIKSDVAINYLDVYSALTKNCKNNECFKFSEKSAFFRLKNKYTVRIILYGTAEFNKKEYNEEKKKINHKANKLYNISKWVPISSSRKLMRVNLIISNNINQALYDYISGDAGILLTRVEGIINLVISDDKLIVPPLKPTVSLMAINRYSDMIGMFLKMLNIEQ